MSLRKIDYKQTKNHPWALVRLASFHSSSKMSRTGFETHLMMKFDLYVQKVTSNLVMRIKGINL
jgi:hypothetical protein